MLRTIALTSEEQEAASQIELARRELLHDHDPERVVKIGDLAFALYSQLATRKAIPRVRLQYFLEPSFNARNPKLSKMDDFQRTVGSGKVLYTHIDFWAYLLYFIHGPKLPSSVIKAFETTASDTFRDGNAMPKLARRYAREVSGARMIKAELFFKLALDCGCELFEALSVRNAVMETK